MPSTSAGTFHSQHAFQNQTAHSQSLPSTQGPSLTLTLWILEGIQKYEAWLNYDLFPPGTCKPGDIVEVRAAGENGPNNGAPESAGGTTTVSSTASEMGTGGGETEATTDFSRVGAAAKSKDAIRLGNGGGNPGDTRKEEGQRFLFVVREMDQELRQKQPNLQISLAASIAHLFGFWSRSSVIVTVVQKELHEASHIEITFRDQYIARSDMWRLATMSLCDRCVYRGKKIQFVGSIKAQVRQIYVRGQKVQSGYFSPRTRPIFRSESARYVIFIQMSREMWHFDTEGSGEIVFNKLINGFLPELFKRWRKINAHHIVSIVLFTRVVYERGTAIGVLNEGEEMEGVDGDGKSYKDFFRVVVSNMACTDWTIILHQLKREFSIFLRDILIQPMPPSENDLSASIETMSPTSPTGTSSSYSRPRPGHIIAGRPSAAIHGNVLEAINLASSQFAKDYIDRDLVRTGISIVIITPGTGHFEVDYESLRMTTENLVSNGIGIDLVCLAKMPLHSVPLFKYKNPIVVSSLARGSSNADVSAGVREEDIASPPVSAGPYGSSLPGRAGMSPPKLSTNHAAPPIETSEWVYAIPHWIDISFWSSSQQQKSIRRTRDGHKGRNKTQFVARCKMYELQMMGIMENEISQISIPFLQDSPFYVPPSARPKGPLIHGLVGSVSNSKEAPEWMETYDDMAFRSLEELKKGVEKAKKKQRKEEQLSLHKDSEKDPHTTSRLGLSDKDRGSPLITGSASDKRAKERRSSVNSHRTIQNPPLLQPTPPVTSPAPPPTTETSKGSILNNPVAALSRPARLARQISFGFRGFGGGTPKATASTGLSSPSLSGPILTRGFIPEGDKVAAAAATSIEKDRPKTPTAIPAKPTSPKTPLQSNLRGPNVDSPDNTPDKSRQWGSRPISIKSTATNATSALERSTARRKTIVGSPFDGIKDRAQIDILKAASMSKSGNPRLDLSGSGGAVLASLSPTSALAPWFSLLNPCNPKKNSASLANQYRRWQHVFPRPLRTASVKWKSLCAPAALPLTTEHFPTAEQLRTEYQENPYVITQNDDDEDLIRNREELVREMISQRLQQGFQIVVGSAVAEATANHGGDNNVFDQNYMTKAGSSVFMSMGSQIHQLICDLEYNVEVKRYVRKPTTAVTTSRGGPAFSMSQYKPYIRTVLCDRYYHKSVNLSSNHAEYNWNYVDQFIGGYEDNLTEQLRFFRARFVLVPTDPPASARRNHYNNTGGQSFCEDNDEEIRLEGIRKLTQLFQRNRYVPPEDRNFEKLLKNRRKDLNPLEILYKTFDPSVVVAQQLESLPLTAEMDASTRRSQLFVGTEMFERGNLNIKTLAQEMQGPKGVRLQDRKWHWRLHQRCFIGSEFVTWMMENFKDLETRQEAVELGNELMKSGLIAHVETRHPFRDGNFFYHITSEYSVNRPSSKGGWFGTKRSNTERAGPTPPVSDTASPSNSRSRSSTIINDDSPEGSGARTPTPAMPRRKIALSKAMKYDVDPLKKSYRPEIVNLHYDRLHNPDNCYHIRIDWMNVTAKLVEDALSSWARTVDRYGLLLVEVPIKELSEIPKGNPFRSPAVIKPSLPPPPAFTGLLPSADLATSFSGFGPKPDPHFYHKAILRKHGFVLDTEAAKNFPPYVEVVFSWGKPTYKYSQYIHKSGVVFAQITDEGEFLLMANRLYTQRVGTGSGRENNKYERGQDQDRNPSAFSIGVGYGISGNGSTMGLHHFPPSTYPMPQSAAAMAGGGGSYVTPEMVKDDLERFCTDEDELRRFYDEIGSRNLNSTAVASLVGNHTVHHSSGAGGNSSHYHALLGSTNPGVDRSILNYTGSAMSLSTSSLLSASGIPPPTPHQLPSSHNYNHHSHLNHLNTHNHLGISQLNTPSTPNPQSATSNRSNNPPSNIWEGFYTHQQHLGPTSHPAPTTTTTSIYSTPSTPMFGPYTFSSHNHNHNHNPSNSSSTTVNNPMPSSSAITGVALVSAIASTSAAVTAAGRGEIGKERGIMGSNMSTRSGRSGRSSAAGMSLAGVAGVISTITPGTGGAMGAIGTSGGENVSTMTVPGLEIAGVSVVVPDFEGIGENISSAVREGLPVAVTAEEITARHEAEADMGTGTGTEGSRRTSMEDKENGNQKVVDEAEDDNQEREVEDDKEKEKEEGKEREKEKEKEAEVRLE